MKNVKITLLVTVILMIASCGDLTTTLEQQIKESNGYNDLTLVAGNGGGVTPERSSVPDKGSVSIKAIPTSGFVFDEWDRISGSGTCTLGDSLELQTTATISGGDVTLKAVFRDADQLPRVTFGLGAAYQVYTTGQSLTLSCTDDYDGIRYFMTGDGSTPADPTETTGTLYSGGAISLPAGSDEIYYKIKAVAYKSGKITSNIASVTYKITGTCAAPVIEATPTGAHIEHTVGITSSTPGVSIYYTEDGSSPTISSTLYNGLFSVRENSQIKAIAYRSDWVDSPVSDKSFSIAWGNLYGTGYSNNYVLDMIQYGSEFSLIGFTGPTHSEIEVTRLNDTSNDTDSQADEIRWAKEIEIGGPGDDLGTVVVGTSDGGLTIAGHIDNEGGFNWSPMVKLSESGDESWSNRFHPQESDDYLTFGGMDQTSSAGYALGGTFYDGSEDSSFPAVTLLNSSGGSPQGFYWDLGDLAEVVITSCVAIPSGTTYGPGIATAGYIRKSGSGSDGDGILILTNNSGSIQRVISIDSPGDNTRIHRMRYTSDGDYLLAGLVGGGSHDDAFLIKLDSSGDKEWQMVWNNGNNDCFYDVKETSDGGFVMTGYTNSDGDPHLWVMKLEGYNDVEWQKSYELQNDSSGRSIIPLSDGGYMVAAVVDSGSSEMAGVLRLDEEGNCTNSQNNLSDTSGTATQTITVADWDYDPAGAGTAGITTLNLTSDSCPDPLVYNGNWDIQGNLYE